MKSHFEDTGAGTAYTFKVYKIISEAGKKPWLKLECTCTLNEYEKYDECEETARKKLKVMFFGSPTEFILINEEKFLK